MSGFLQWLYRLCFPRSRRGRQARMEASWQEGIQLQAEGRYSESEERLDRTITIAAEDGAPLEVLRDALDQLADFYKSTGRYSKAEPLYERSLELQQQKYGPEDLRYLMTLNDLALLHYAQGKNKDSEDLYRRLLPALERQLPGDSLELAVALENYAALLRRTDQQTESSALVSRATEIRRRLKEKAASPMKGGIVS